MEFLSEYDFDIKHIKGKENKVANALKATVAERDCSVPKAEPHCKPCSERNCNYVL
jgi:hypothetical protein